MRYWEIKKYLLEDQDPVGIAKNIIIDILSNLRSQGVNSITFDQIVDILKSNPELSSINVDQNFVEQAVSSLNGVELQTNSSGVLCLILDDNTTTPTPKNDNQSKVDDMATNSAMDSIKDS